MREPSFYNRSLLERIIETSSVQTVFQPICSIRKQMVAGIEALSRGIDPASGEFLSPLGLFELARQEDLLLEFDRVCRHQALKAFASIQPRYPKVALFLNLDAGIIDSDRRRIGMLDQVTDAMGIDPGRVVIELLESRVSDMASMADFVADRKRRGFLIGLDDLGAGHSNLSRVPMVQPNVLKIDQGIVAGLEDDYYKREVFDICVLLAHRIGAVVVAEGIETESQALEAVERGADLLQGYYLSMPQVFSESLMGGALARTRGLAARYREQAIHKAHSKREEARRHSQISKDVIGLIDQAGNGDLADHLLRAAEREEIIECLYVLDGNGIQLSPTVFNPRHLPTETKVLFHPAERGTDHSLKEYVIFIRTGLEQFLTNPYISSASGRLTRTLSVAHRHTEYGDLIVCIDFYPET